MIIPNLVGTFTKKIMIDMWASDAESESLSVTWSCKCPSIQCEPSEITIPFAFLNHAYARTIEVTNTSNLQGYFYILPQEVEAHTPVIVSLAFSELYLDGGGAIEIPMTIIASKLGASRVEIR